jgi:Family of unknown function (DUF6062)
MSSRAPRDTAAFEVRDALGHAAGCAVCHLALRSVKRQIRSIAYEQVNDLDLRAQLRRAHGFCNAHAHQWLREARNVLGTALIYRDVLRASADELESGATRRGGLLQGLFSAEREAACPVCEAQRNAESRYVSALVGLMAADSAVRTRFEASAGLCRLHVLAALRIGGPGAEAIVVHTRQRIEALVAELDEVIRKEDYRFRHEPRTEGEKSAPSRAINWATGSDGLTR